MPTDGSALLQFSPVCRPSTCSLRRKSDEQPRRLSQRPHQPERCMQPLLCDTLAALSLHTPPHRRLRLLLWSCAPRWLAPPLPL